MFLLLMQMYICKRQIPDCLNESGILFFITNLGLLYKQYLIVMVMDKGLKHQFFVFIYYHRKRQFLFLLRLQNQRQLAFDQVQLGEYV